ncbi:NADP-dependent oxidoreductase [Phytomonospora endophytica]|uniref:NADPH:quinone reductase-like Zn-dependent oxidoreductase n=1 Tax=Phytomonospora endophytica TaxID=714109 RepID=A0A841FMZ4_9ACTN|nr:NADP-dependent oxidoreductase [Phytomonospora endophytica]MBB6035168.1 NADPH:quinone reductase-like Zn-dependent oxidoreductase [Phytomonospora endophytica]
MTNMKAAVVRAFGGPAALTVTDLPIPAPAPGEVLVKIAAAAVNPADIGMRDGRYPWRDAPRMPIVPGYDITGTVAALGDGLAGTGLAVGDRVLAITMHAVTQTGSYAEYAALPARQVVATPANLGLVEAVTLPLNALTARRIVERLDLDAGRTLLVNAPRSAVGAYVAQWAASAGITVVAPDEVTGPVDAAVDTIGGTRARAAFDAVADGGRYVSIVPEFWVPGGVFAAERGIEPALVALHSLGDGDLGDVVRAVESGELVPTPVDRTMPLSEAVRAHELLEAGGLRGKLVLTP